MMSRRLASTLAALAVVLLVVAEAGAGAPSDQLSRQVERVVRILEDPELRKEAKVRERRAAIRQVANEIFDFAEITRRSLGRHWQARTPAEREEFVQLLGDLLEYSYVSKIELYSGEKIAFIGEALESDQATVRTRVVTKQGTEIPIDYRMLRRDERWLAYDVSIEGISLVANYRTQFDRVIQRSSYQELVKTMKAKQAERRDGATARRREAPAAAAGAPAPAAAAVPADARARPPQAP